VPIWIWQLLVKKIASNQLRVGCWAVVDVFIDRLRERERERDREREIMHGLTLVVRVIIRTFMQVNSSSSFLLLFSVHIYVLNKYCFILKLVVRLMILFWH
jgi:hypothetical protein